MDEFYNKHYIQVDLKGRIIKGFSDAFEQPIEGDICINEKGGRHFEMLGVVNPPLMNMQGIYIYKWADDEVMERTAEEIQIDIDNLPQPEPTMEERVSDTEFSLNLTAATLLSRVKDSEVMTHTLLDKIKILETKVTELGGEI